MKERRWRYCIIGGLAVQKWGEPRTTLDPDLSLFAPYGEEDEFVVALLARFKARALDAHAFALQNRFSS